MADRERRQWAFYRYHLDDPIYFDDGCEVAIQTIGGCGKAQAIELQQKGAALTPVSIDTTEPKGFTRLLDLEPPIDLQSPATPDGRVNFWRQDDWSATAYFYLDFAAGVLPAIAPVEERVAGLSEPAEA